MKTFKVRFTNWRGYCHYRVLAAVSEAALIEQVNKESGPGFRNIGPADVREVADMGVYA